MRKTWALLGLWLGACASAPAHEAKSEPVAPVAHAVLAAAVLAPPPARPVTLRVIVGGDVIPHRPQLEDPASVAAALAPLAPLFRSADAAVVNYETATGTLAPGRDAPMTFGASPAWMRAVASANVTALSLANNHACDLGRRGLAASVVTAQALGVTALGASAGDPWEAKILAERAGKRVCAVAWTTFVNARPHGCEGTGHLALAPATRAGRARAALAIERARRGGCDAVVAIVHGGVEYVPQTAAMLGLARAVADAGADAVVLHHPHVVSPLVLYDTRDGRRVPIFESLGNLVSNQGESWTPAYPAAQKNRRIVYLNGWTRLGMLAELSFDFRPGRRQPLARWGYHLVFVDSDHVLDKSNPHPNIDARTLDPDADKDIVAKLARDPKGPREVFGDPCWLDRAEAPRSACQL